MEHVRVLLDDGTGKDFDDILRGALREGGDLTFATKDGATTGGKTGVIVAFTVELPDGSYAKAQAVTTLRNMGNLFRLLVARYGLVENGGEL